MKNPIEPELDQDLKESLESLRPVPARNLQMAARGRAAFLAEAASLHRSRPKLEAIAVSSVPDKRHTGWIDKLNQVFRRKEPSPMFHPLIAILVSLSLIFGGTGVVTAAAQSSMPNDFLYPVKTLSEDVRLALSTRTQTRLSLEQSFANRRVGEIVRMAARGEMIPDKVTSRLQTALDESLKLAAGLDEPAMQQALVRMQTNTQQQLEYMAQSAGQSDEPALEQARLRLREQLRLAELGLVDPQGYQEQVRTRTRQRQNQPTEIPPSTPVATQPGPQHTPSPEGGYGPGPQAGTQTRTPVQNGTGPGPGPMEPTRTSGPSNGNGQGGPQATQTPGQGDGYGPGPGPLATTTPGSNGGQGNGQGGMMTQTPEPGSGNGPGPQVTPQGTCTCTPVQDGTGPGPGPGPMDPTRTPGSGGGEGGGGGGGKP